MHLSRRTLALGLLLAPALAACDEELGNYSPGGSGTPSGSPWVIKDPAFLFQVTTSSFNGWDPSATPSPSSLSIPAVAGQKLTTRGLAHDTVFTIEKIRGQKVTFTTSEPLTAGRLDEATDRFTVTYGRDLELETPTMDVAVNYVVTLQLGA